MLQSKLTISHWNLLPKNLHSAPPRLARMLLRVQRYNITVKYVPGKEIPLANALSHITPCPANTIEGLDISVHELHYQLNASSIRIQEIRDETAKDTMIAILRETIAVGWPKKRSDSPECSTHIGITAMSLELRMELFSRDQGSLSLNLSVQMC